MAMGGRFKHSKNSPGGLRNSVDPQRLNSRDPWCDESLHLATDPRDSDDLSCFLSLKKSFRSQGNGSGGMKTNPIAWAATTPTRSHRENQTTQTPPREAIPVVSKPRSNGKPCSHTTSTKSRVPNFTKRKDTALNLRSNANPMPHPRAAPHEPERSPRLISSSSEPDRRRLPIEESKPWILILF